ncbi:MAG: RNA polymerase sigma factor [Lacunisphaera sp.]
MTPPPLSAPPAEAPDPAQWFKREVHLHDGHLKAYLRGAFPALGDVEDVVQESYLRVWKNQAAGRIKSAKAFLFAVARNLALDALRRKKVSPLVFPGDLAALSVSEDSPGVVHGITEREKISLVGDAVVALPARVREIFILHKFQDIPQAEIARRFGLTEKAVEHQVARGVQLCAQYLRRHGHELF